MKKKKVKGMQAEVISGITVVVKGITKKLVRNEGRWEEFRAISSPVLSFESHCKLADLILPPSKRIRNI